MLVHISEWFNFLLSSVYWTSSRAAKEPREWWGNLNLFDSVSDIAVMLWNMHHQTGCICILISFFFCNFHILPFLFLGIISFKCCSGNWCQSPILFYIFVLRKPCPLLKTVYSLLQNVPLSNSFLVTWLGRHGENNAKLVSVAGIQDFLLTVLFEVHVLLTITHVVWRFLRCWWPSSTRITVWEHLYIGIILSLQLSDAYGEFRFASVALFRFYHQISTSKN